MSLILHVQRLSLIIVSLVVVAASASGNVGCGGDPTATASAPASALRQRFPEHAAKVLEQGEAFVTDDAGFALGPSSARGAWNAVLITLPRDGRDAIRLRGFGGVEIRVREIDAQGEGALAERAVVYRRAGRTSFWTATSGGVEEWLHLEADAVRAGEAAAM